MVNVLVLCMGNSSRSQMAEGYLKYYAHGLAEFHSAGLHDRGVNPLTIQVMAEDNIDISESRSKSYRQFEHQSFDYLITVCDEANRQVPSTISAKKHIHFSIPDPDRPFEQAEEQFACFRQTRELVKKHILKFIGRELASHSAIIFS